MDVEMKEMNSGGRQLQTRPILATRSPKKIGERLVGVLIGDHFFEDQPFLVLRQATLEEWAECWEDADLPDPSETWFYEVSMD